MTEGKAVIRKVAWHDDRGIMIGILYKGDEKPTPLWSKTYEAQTGFKPNGSETPSTFADPPHDFQDYLRRFGAAGACDDFTVQFREVHPHKFIPGIHEGDFMVTENDCADAGLPRWSS